MVTANSNIVTLFKAKPKLTALWINTNHCPDGPPHTHTLLGSHPGDAPLWGHPFVGTPLQFRSRDFSK